LHALNLDGLLKASKLKGFRFRSGLSEFFIPEASGKIPQHCVQAFFHILRDAVEQDPAASAARHGRIDVARY